MDAQNTFSRRRMIIVSTASAIGTALMGTAIWPLWNYLSFREKGADKRTVTIPRSKVGPGQVFFFPFRGHPAVVLQMSPGEFTALSAVCTHLGCIVTWQPREKIFLCPCHAGTFSPTGQVLAGPPPAPLPSYPVTAEQDQLIIG